MINLVPKTKINSSKQNNLQNAVKLAIQITEYGTTIVD